MIDANLVKFLEDAGTTAGARVHTGPPQQGATMPYIIIQRTEGAQPRVLGGRKLFPRARFQVIAVAKSQAEALPLAAAIYARLVPDVPRYDMAGESTTTSVKVCRRENGPIDVTVTDGDLKLGGYAQEFSFMYLDP